MADEEKKEEGQEEELSQEELAKQWEEALAQQQPQEGEAQEAQEESQEEVQPAEAPPQEQVAEKKVTERDITKLLDRLMDIPLNVEVVVGETVIQIRELINLGPGSVLELDRETTEPVDIKVNGKLIAKGELVVVGEKFGVRITEIYSEERKSVFRDTLQESLRK
ncbi:flagellar motor switch protein FliN [Hydrogenivirga sp. 128-5-R1-1]|uniref:flagellar motor switch protein FliN n=1 Tax=Hydrogenivirga sp. 128-5-R1-1 TaxID=392423 RepID=UPI00015F3924|nr:flagellar motor switch protein FliN [Hydrogenivirga sp. 128-5-R1-1]EDP75006.1 flagellar motor switch FliN [Hydrogenivirga sp. 128-5-R1-1]